MTTRVKSLTVVLDGEPREDDVESLINAIRHLRGVSDVIQADSDAEFDLAKYKAKRELITKVYAAIDGVLK